MPLYLLSENVGDSPRIRAYRTPEARLARLQEIMRAWVAGLPPAPGSGGRRAAFLKLIDTHPWDAWTAFTTVSGHSYTLDDQDLESAAVPESAGSPPHIIIHVEGGLVQEVLSPTPLDYTVIDYDTEGAMEEDVVPLPQDETPRDPAASPRTAEAYCSACSASVLPARVAELLTAIDQHQTKHQP